MALFECNFNSYCKGRPVTITVVIPTAGWNEMGYTDDMLMSMKNLAPDNFTDTIEYVPLWKRIKTFDHTPKAKYPVVYLLCGGQDDRTAWRDRTQAVMFCEERKLALVMVDAEDGEWHMNRDYEFLAKEMPEFVCGMFPVSSRPCDRYIAGTSRGAGGAVHQILKAPEAFGAAGIFSSSITFFEDAPVAMTNEFFADGQKLPPVYISVGDGDNSGRRLRAYRDLLCRNGADVTYVEEPGYGHGYRLCNVALEKFLNWLPRTDYYAQFIKPSPERADGIAMKYMP